MGNTTPPPNKTNKQTNKQVIRNEDVKDKGWTVKYVF